MKRLIYIVTFLISLNFMSCGLANHDYVFRSYTVGEPLTVTVGSPMLVYEEGTKNDVYNTVMKGGRVELVFMGCEKDIINIQYREYYIQAGRMYVRDGLTQNLKYDLSKGSVITYGKTDIEILGTENNKVTFKVIKQG